MDGKALKNTLLLGVSAVALMLGNSAALAASCTDGGAISIGVTGCTVETGAIPSSVTFDAGATGTLTLDGQAPTGEINAMNAGEGLITVENGVSLNADIGKTKEMQKVVIDGTKSGALSASDKVIGARDVVLSGSGASLSLAGNSEIRGSVLSSGGIGGSAGSIVISGATEISGSLGESFDTTRYGAIDNVSIQDGASLTVKGDSVVAKSITLGTGSILYAGGLIASSIDGGASNTGSLVIDRDAITGFLVDNVMGTNITSPAIGASNGLHEILVENGAKFSIGEADVKTDALIIDRDSIVEIGRSNFTGNIVGKSDGVGTLKFLGGGAISGYIGYNGTYGEGYLDSVELLNSGDFNFHSSTIFANSVKIGSSTVLVAEDASIVGNVEGLNDGEGALVLKTGGGVLGTIGATNRLASVKLAMGGTYAIDATHGLGTNAISVATGTTLSVSDATVLGTIDGDSDGEGALQLGTGALLKGNVGASHRLNSISVTNGFMSVKGITLAADTLSLSGGATGFGLDNSVFTGAVEGADNGVGKLALTNGGRVEGSIGATHALEGLYLTSDTTLGQYVTSAGLVSVMQGDGNRHSTLRLAGDLNASQYVELQLNTSLSVEQSGSSISGDVRLWDSRLDLSDKLLNVNGSIQVILGSSPVITLTVGKDYGGRIDLATGGIEYLGGGKIVVQPTYNGSFVRNGDRVVVVNAANAVSGTGTVEARNSALVNWTARVADATDAAFADRGVMGRDLYGQTIDAGKDLVLVASVAVPPPANGGGNGQGPLPVLLGYSGSDPAFSRFIGDVQGIGSTGELAKTTEQLHTDISGSLQNAPRVVQTSVSGVVSKRTGGLRSQGRASGLSSGEVLKGFGVWGETFGALTSQGERSGVDGYDQATYGLAMGGDAKVTDRIRLGAALTYARSNIENDGASDGSGSDVDSYVGSLYGTYQGAPWYIDGMVSYGLHQYDTHRKVETGGTVRTPKADFNGQQASAEIKGGYPLPLGKAVVVPEVGLAYSHLSLDGYTEHGGDGADLIVEGKDYDTLRASIGANVGATLQAGQTKVRPEARVGYGYDIVADKVMSAQRFAAGGASFVSQGADPARHSVNLGLGVKVFPNDVTTISADYDVDLREKYVEHTGKARVRVDF